MDVPDGFPPLDFPVVFADGVRSASWSKMIAKVYLARIDPHFTGSGESHQMPHIQIVFPMDGFLGSMKFLNEVVKRLARENIITREQADAALAKDSEDAS